jgi:single-stranded-DNA-specific exonuclease
VEGFHLFQGLRACRPHLVKFGGHEAAAGFTINEAEMPALQEALAEAFLAQVGEARLRPTLRVDAAVDLFDLDQNFYQHLQLLRPFGPGNPEPVFVCETVECLSSRVVGERHLKVQFSQGGVVQEAIAFDQAPCHPLSGPLEVAFSTRFSFFMGRFTPELRLLDWARPKK